MMLREQLKKLFTSYDPTIRQIIDEVGELEQMHISMKKPHLTEHIDSIVERIARQQLNQHDSDAFEE
jgi:hypothetical protein